RRGQQTRLAIASAPRWCHRFKTTLDSPLMPNARIHRSRRRRTARLSDGPFGTVTLRYWFEDGWYCGQLREVPEVISQCRTFKSLRRNIRSGWATWSGYCRELAAKEGIRAGLEDLAAGRVRGGFKTAKALIADLHRRARRRTRARAR